MKLAESFPCRVEILKGNETINGKSILDLLTLGAGNGTTLTLRASGEGAQAAVEALAKLIEAGFNEMPPAEEKAWWYCTANRLFSPIRSLPPPPFARLRPRLSNSPYFHFPFPAAAQRR